MELLGWKRRCSRRACFRSPLTPEETDHAPFVATLGTDTVDAEPGLANAAVTPSASAAHPNWSLDPESGLHLPLLDRPAVLSPAEPAGDEVTALLNLAESGRWSVERLAVVGVVAGGTLAGRSGEIHGLAGHLGKQWTGGRGVGGRMVYQSLKY